jgi:hypothetical protein
VFLGVALGVRVGVEWEWMGKRKVLAVLVLLLVVVVVLLMLVLMAATEASPQTHRSRGLGERGCGRWRKHSNDAGALARLWIKQLRGCGRCLSRRAVRETPSLGFTFGAPRRRRSRREGRLERRSATMVTGVTGVTEVSL